MCQFGGCWYLLGKPSGVPGWSLACLCTYNVPLKQQHLNTHQTPNIMLTKLLEHICFSTRDKSCRTVCSSGILVWFLFSLWAFMCRVHILPVSTQVHRCSGFLPQSKDMHFRLISNSWLAVGVSTNDSLWGAWTTPVAPETHSITPTTLNDPHICLDDYYSWWMNDYCALQAM